MKTKPNDELLHEWRTSLQQRRGLKPSTIAAKLAALRDYEAFTSRRSFLKLSGPQVAAFKEHLLTSLSLATGERLACSTVVHTVDHCRDFFSWLADRKEGRHLDREAVSWFSATRADKERARAVPPRAVPSLEEARTAFACMPAETLLNRRNRALFATLLLTAIRADALASLPLGSVDPENNTIWQDGRFVRTKNSKSFSVFFLPFIEEARQVLKDWIVELHSLGLSSGDALFPRDMELLRIEAGERLTLGEYPTWQGSSQVRAIVRGAFVAAGLPAHSPHVFRHMFAKHVFALRPAAEEIIAFSINLGHKKLETTLNPYARPDDKTRAMLIAQLGGQPEGRHSVDVDALVVKLLSLDPEKAAKVFVEVARR